MTTIFQNLIRNPLVRAQVLAQVRNLLGAATGALALWLSAHVTDMGTAKLIAGAVLNIGMALATAYFSHQDVKGVDAKINAAIALAPQTPQETIVALKDGKF